MKKLLIFLMILLFVCIVAVSCGADATPAETTTDVTRACGLTTEDSKMTEPEAVDTTKTPTSDATPESSTAITTKTPESTQKPVSTTRDPDEGWGPFIPIT